MPLRRIKKIARTERFFKGMRVRDAEQTILVQPTTEDINKGKKGDPEGCAYAVCVKRMLNTHTVYVYHTVAYVQVLDATGQAVLERYLLKDGARRNLEDYDDDEKVKPAGFKLKAPNYAATLDYKAAMRKQWKRDGSAKRWSETRKARLQAEKNGKKRLIRHRVVAKKTIGSFRDGTGCVRFIGTAEGYLSKREMRGKEK